MTNLNRPEPLLSQPPFSARRWVPSAIRLCRLNDVSPDETACLLGCSKRTVERRWWDLCQAASAQKVGLDDPKAARELMRRLCSWEIWCNVDEKTWDRAVDTMAADLDFRLVRQSEALRQHQLRVQLWLRQSGLGSGQLDPKAVEDLLQQLDRSADQGLAAAAHRTGKPPEG